MAGIYIHIPFCRQACHYCDFHFSTNLKTQNEMVNAISQEIIDRKDYLTGRVDTIYFGGGTPSLLTTDQIKRLLAVIDTNYEVGRNSEITLEANPEDLSAEKALQLYHIGINRLSIGIQTFDEHKLVWMNRAHNSDEALAAFNNARLAGFQNISLDLIYAIPEHSQERWEADLKAITSLNPEHISLYGLTIEDETVFGKWEKQDKLIQLPEDDAAKQYLFAIDFLQTQGYIQYEVSNFGKTGFHSRHNNAYWSRVPYLGVGPGAHSFNGNSRRFNIRNNSKYIKAIHSGDAYFESEMLSEVQQINEQILTQLRTAKGLNLNALKRISNTDIEELNADFINQIRLQELIDISEGFLCLQPKGFLVADEIALRLFLPE